MKTQRAQLTAIRDMAERTANGDEAAAQYLYGIGIGSLTREEANGFRYALDFTLSNITFVEEA